MIELLAPAAVAGVALLAGPLLVHMLLRRNARHVRFPAMRFLAETRAAAVRLRRPSDVTLLIVRLAIVGAAIIAAAQPVFVTSSRLAQWDARTIRAVIVDEGASPREERERLAQQELTSAFGAARFAGRDLSDAVARAAAWLADAPPGRREVVILSEFQRGAIDRHDLAVLTEGTGVRTIRTGTPPPAREVRLPAVDGFRDRRWQPAARLDQTGTAVTWTTSASAPRTAWLTTSQAEREGDAASRAVHAAVAAGVVSGDDTRRVHIQFAGASRNPATPGPLRTAWMVDAALALRRSALLRQTQASVTTAERDGQFVVETSASAASNDAAAVVRAVVLAVRPPSLADVTAEVVTIPDAELAAWRREASPMAPSSDRLNLTDESGTDAKWFWAIALALLAVEGWLRGRTTQSAAEQVRNAA